MLDFHFGSNGGVITHSLRMCRGHHLMSKVKSKTRKIPHVVINDMLVYMICFKQLEFSVSLLLATAGWWRQLFNAIFSAGSHHINKNYAKSLCISIFFSLIKIVALVLFIARLCRHRWDNNKTIVSIKISWIIEPTYCRHHFNVRWERKREKNTYHTYS